MPDCEEDPEPQVQIQPKHHTKSNTASPAKEDAEYTPPVLSFMEETEIEMEVSECERCDVDR